MRHIKVYFTLIFTLVLVLAFVFADSFKSSSQQQEVEKSTPDYQTAIQVADQLWEDKSDLHRSDYKLVKVENLVFSGASYKGPYFWKITYLANDMIEGDRIKGKGGQIFIEVDLRTEEGKLTGYGE